MELKIRVIGCLDEIEVMKGVLFFKNLYRNDKNCRNIKIYVACATGCATHLTEVNIVSAPDEKSIFLCYWVSNFATLSRSAIIQ